MPPRRPDKAVQIHLWISQDLQDQVDLLLLDPVRNRVKYGARSKLVEKLFTQWLASHKKQEKQNNE